MKLSEAIARLTELQQQYGDKELSALTYEVPAVGCSHEQYLEGIEYDDQLYCCVVRVRLEYSD